MSGIKVVAGIWVSPGMLLLQPQADKDKTKTVTNATAMNAFMIASLVWDYT
jgi:hypothetical protein